MKNKKIKKLKIIRNVGNPVFPSEKIKREQEFKFEVQEKINEIIEKLNAK